MITSNQSPSGKPMLWLAGAVMLTAAAAVPVHGESFKYYVWTDENNVVHIQDAPPDDHEYETRVIDDIDANVMTSTDVRSSVDDLESSRSGSLSDAEEDDETASTGTIPRQSTSGVGREVLLEEARREQAAVNSGPRSILPPDGASPTDSTLPRSILPEARDSRSGLDPAPLGSSPPDGSSPTDSGSPASIVPQAFR